MNNNQNNQQQKQANGQAPMKKSSSGVAIAIIVIVIVLLGGWLGFEKGRSGSMNGTASSTMPDMTDMSTSTISAPSAPSSTSTIPSSISTGTTTVTVPLTQVPFIYVISTDKKTYSQNEQINMIIAVINNTSASSTFSFPTGCQGDYSVAGFDLAKHILCRPGASSFILAPHHEGDIPLAFYPSVATLPVGTWPLYASVIGYGGATTTITITK